MTACYGLLLGDQFNTKSRVSKSYLFKQVHGGLGILMEQVVKHQEQTCHDKRHRTLLGIHVHCQFHNCLDTKHHDRSAAPLREIVKNKQQQLEMFNIQIFRVTGKSPLQGILLQCAHKPDNKRGSLLSLLFSLLRSLLKISLIRGLRNIFIIFFPAYFSITGNFTNYSLYYVLE